jgi:pyridoxal phosphate enzyme (YggS family)
VERAATAAGRDAASVSLIAISKRHPAESIREAYAAGQRLFGENYAQELTLKRESLADLPGIQWHFVGALQSNKARYLVPGTALIHAVDRLSAADALSRRAAAVGASAEVLVEVNIGNEQSKSGVVAQALPELLSAVAALPSITVKGLMCIPPPTPTPEASRPFFRKLRELRDGVRNEFPSVELLSMGMSHDFEEAIAEGATHVRVGTAIFGDRPLK